MEMAKLSPWRLNSPFAQATVISMIMFCCSGMNGTVLALGAGGSRAEMIPLVNRITAVGLAVAAVAALFGGSMTNKLGPKTTLLIATSGYPSFVACLWLLDHGLATWYAWFATVWHGISAGAMYPAAGYVVTAYSPEHLRGRYVASMWASQLAGGIVGSCIVLGITAGTGNRSAGVPNAVYAAIVSVQSLGFVFALFIKSPQSIRRNDGTAIAHFKLLSWKEEIIAMKGSFMRPETLLLAVALFACTMPYSLIGAMNSFFFSARTRALAALCYGISSFLGTIAMSACDWSALGRRRRRAQILGALILLISIAAWVSLFWFLGTHPTHRGHKGLKTDWTDASDYLKLLYIIPALGFSYATYYTFHMWLCSSFSNQPDKLGRQYGYITCVRMTGTAVAYGLDSHRISFLKETTLYFVLIIVGGVLAWGSAWFWLRDSRYGDGDEVGVIVPKGYDVHVVVEEVGSERGDPSSLAEKSDGNLKEVVVAETGLESQSSLSSLEEHDGKVVVLEARGSDFVG